jgi:1,4-alpha-glucan branching enzyme
VNSVEIGTATPLGATLVAGGATFRVWAPAARKVIVVVAGAHEAPGVPAGPAGGEALAPLGDGTWGAFVPGVADGTAYRFWIEGEGRAGFKRDPRARELSLSPPFPDSACLVRDPHGYPWHDTAYRPPDFRDLVIYQLHVGAFFGLPAAPAPAGPTRTSGGAAAGGGDASPLPDPRLRVARFLDTLGRLDYLRDLGVNAVQLLPVQEYPTEFSLGYNGTDYFSPELEYEVGDGAELGRYLELVNGLLAARRQPPLTAAQLAPGVNQLKCLVDLFHLSGIAVIFDLVYNHAGGGFDDHGMYFFDRQADGDQNHSLYFTDRGWAGGLAFALWNRDVRRFLLDNAELFLEEYHIDGIRYDEVSALRDLGGGSADLFCHELTSAVRRRKPQAIQIAEYWSADRATAVLPPPGGLGFDAAMGDALRDRVRATLAAAAAGAQAELDLAALAEALLPRPGFPAAWMVVQCLENHDVVYTGREPRIAALCDPGDPLSWYARSRARVAAGLLLTAPGIPMLFMGEEFLAERRWNDNTAADPGSLISWIGLERDRPRQDYLRFMQDLVALRRAHAALRGEEIAVTTVHGANRVLAFRRWIAGEDATVLVVASFYEETWRGYRIGFPAAGRWREVFNSDFYDHFPNPQVAGNGGVVAAASPGMDGLPAAAAITIPANGLLVFTRA